ncbi:hypothetical protein FOCC_FOCC012903 [Frankliniella occidentalis]|nr:hypothetical protein FOCC_FOCC012903 [Frankliniella occidentalis]
MPKTQRVHANLRRSARANLVRHIRGHANAEAAAADEYYRRNDRLHNDLEVNRELGEVGEIVVNVRGEAEVQNQAGRRRGGLQPEPRPLTPPREVDRDEGRQNYNNPLGADELNEENNPDDVEPEDSDEEMFDEGVDIEAVPGDTPLYNNANITINESMVMVLSLMLNHNLTGSCIEDLLQVINFHCPAENLHKLSYHKFRKFTRCGKVPMKKKFYCSVCMTGLENEDALCTVCGVDREKNYFVQLPLAPQLRELYKRNSFYNSLQHRHNRVRAGPDNCIEDIYDGSVYKAQEGQGGFLSNRNNISLTWYTDGVPVFSSKNYSIWPFMFLINELPYRMRARRKNVLMAGLWFGPHKPSANLYMRSFLPELRRLYTDGVRVSVADLERINIPVKAIVLAGVCDTPAKSNFLNVAGFSGFYGCPVCEIRGETLNVAGTDHHVYPYQERLTLRTTARFENFARQALQVANATGVQGVKGPTALHLIMPDFLKGAAVDPMHLVTGVVKKLLQLHFDSNHSDESFSLRNVLRVADLELLKIKPPKFIHRKAQTLEEFHRRKASQLMCWFLYYSLPIYKNIMKLEYYYHYLKLVAAISLLNANSVSVQNIQKAERLLKEFVKDFEGLYHLKFCSINIHLLLHLPNCVRHLGPLWVYTCFPMEDLNGKIIGNIHGKTSVDSQFCNTFWQVLCQHRKLNTIIDGPKKDFIKKRKRSVKITDQIAPGCYSVGNYKIFGREGRHIVNALEAAHINPQNTSVYFRLLKGSMIYASKGYVEAGWIHVVPISCLRTVCVAMNTYNDLYLAEPVNSYEVE